MRPLAQTARSRPGGCYPRRALALPLSRGLLSPAAIVAAALGALFFGLATILGKRSAGLPRPPGGCQPAHFACPWGDGALDPVGEARHPDVEASTSSDREGEPGR